MRQITAAVTVLVLVTEVAGQILSTLDWFGSYALIQRLNFTNMS